MTQPEPEKKRWVRYPDPGQFRGEGPWYDYDEFAKKLKQVGKEEYWEWLIATSFLPTKIQEFKPE